MMTSLSSKWTCFCGVEGGGKLLRRFFLPSFPFTFSSLSFSFLDFFFFKSLWGFESTYYR